MDHDLHDVINEDAFVDAEVQRIAIRWRARGFATFEPYTVPLDTILPASRYEGVMGRLLLKRDQEPDMELDHERILQAVERASRAEHEFASKRERKAAKAKAKASRKAARQNPGRGVRVVHQSAPVQRQRPVQRDVITYDGDGVLRLNGVRSESSSPRQQHGSAIDTARAAANVLYHGNSR